MNARNFIEQLLRPPIIGGDEPKNRLAATLNTVLWYTLLALLCLIPLIPILQLTRAGYWIILVLIVLDASGLFLLKKGHVYSVAIGFSIALWLIPVGIIVISGQLRNTEIMGILVAVVAAGLLVGLWAVMVFSTLSILAVISLAFAEAQGWLVPLVPTYPAGQVVMAVFNIILITGLLAMVLKSLKEAETRTRQDTTHLDEKSQSLQRLLISAEEQMLERAHNAEVARQEAEVARKMVEAQGWMVIGQARLNQVMRGEPSVTELANNIASQLCHYLDAQPCAIFVCREDIYEWSGGYAYLPGDSFRAAFKLGEGIAGQAALEERRIILDNLPEDYMPIVSGLGDSYPRQIAICPLIYSRKIIGVLEIGTLTTFGSQELEFLDLVSESIAIALNTAQTRSQVNDLLKETQRMAAELKAQEEELQAVNEELEAQAEALRSARKE